MPHIPVLTKEVLENLNPKPNENFIDGTIGGAGHAVLILEKTGLLGRLLGLDADKEQVKRAREMVRHYQERVVLVNDSYANVAEIVKEARFNPVDGLLLDLGYSSYHVDESGKGFSFQKDEALDMRFANGELTAGIIVNTWPEKELQKIIEEYGEEKFARQIARGILKQRKIRPIQSTFELVKVIEEAIPSKFQRGGIHYATRTFQALRIAVNDELQNLQKGLEGALQVLVPGGRLVVISFHSLEDRIVKLFFQEQEKLAMVRILTKKPIIATQNEVLINPRSRSAKLRAIIKL